VESGGPLAGDCDGHRAGVQGGVQVHAQVANAVGDAGGLPCFADLVGQCLSAPGVVGAQFAEHARVDSPGVPR